MFKYPSPLLSLILTTSIVLSGCSLKSKSPEKENHLALTPEQRAAQLLQNNKWQLRGKIAFIQKVKSENGSKTKDKRESASLNWQVNNVNQTQELNLTSFLGINVLRLESNQNQHFIKVDGKEFRGTNLPQLIYSLTGLTLPTKALNYWLKGLPYKENDDVKTDKNTQLPISISSYYNNALWQINYSNYRVFDGINMATKFTIKKDNLLIKIAVKKWAFTN